jgi:hypothetical protein
MVGADIRFCVEKLERFDVVAPRLRARRISRPQQPHAGMQQ